MHFIRKIPTAKRIGWHPSHLMRKVRAGEFPAPVQIGPNSIAFVEEEVEAWMKARAAERDATTDIAGDSGEGDGDHPSCPSSAGCGSPARSPRIGLLAGQEAADAK